MGLLRLTQTASQSEDCLQFLAVALLEEQSLEGFSPRTMRWNEGIYLIDMRACRAFWLHVALQREEDASQLIREELRTLTGGDSYHATAAATPGEALLLLQLAKDKGFQGIIHADSRFGRNLLRGLSWDLWWDFYEDYAHKKGISKGILNKSRLSMQLAMRRLGLKKPDQLRNLPGAHLQRRFGKTVAEAWTLAFPQRQGLTAKEAIGLFPWQPLVTPEIASIKRYLDHQLRDWPVIEELLREDLNRLLILGSFKKGERILKLEWRIVLCDLQEIPITILFRHPHNLHQDSPRQRTALLQIQYMFEKNPQIRAASQESGLISWQLIVVEKAPSRFRQGSLFQESSDDIMQLRQLENMLPRPLIAFRLAEDWLAEDSFHQGDGEGASNGTGMTEDYLALSHKRPLFLYREPHPLDLSSMPMASLGAFQERTMGKWWRGAASQRDYYQLSHQGILFWVFRDQSGNWHRHGVYG